MKTAIIGAGIAGLSAARALSSAGRDVSIFDKGRGPGGRLSTRRAATPLGELRWDHGAPYFQAGTSAFTAEIERLAETGAITRWKPRIADVRQQDAGWTVGVRPVGARQEQYLVGQPAMNAVIKALAEGRSIGWGRRVSAIIADGGAKTLQFEDGSLEGPFDEVIVAVPAEQAVPLLEPVSPSLASEAASVNSEVRWVVMIAFEREVDVPWDVAHIAGSALSLAVRNASKPGREQAETWVLHASAAWSREHVDLSREVAAAKLTEAFREVTGTRPVFSSAHRWLYAQVAAPAGSPFGWDADEGIAAIGDWRLGPTVEDAWMSGRECANYLTGLYFSLEK